MSERTIFDEIMDGTMAAWKVWEDDNYLAFLTPFANTPGVTIVIPKTNPGDYILTINPAVMHGLMDAVTKVSGVLERALDVQRVAVVFEGTGVKHVHAKLYPLHGALGGQTGVWSNHLEFHPQYNGYITTAEGPKMSDQELTDIQQKIQKAAQQ